MKYGERSPRSNCMPSTTSSSVCRPLPSSTVITPSFPTFSIASEMIFPISLSALAEIAPTWAISLLEVQALEILFSSSTTAMTAWSMPRFKSIGSMPEATNFMPSFTIDWASTVAVVVPSPATSEVLDATSFSICAPMFSNLSLSSISLATDTPSLVTVGAPYERSRITLRPLGPRVTLTASARILTPASILWRAGSWKRTSLAGMFYSLESLDLLCDDTHDVVFAHYQILGALDLHRLAGELAEQDAVADLDVQRTHFPVFEDLALADRDDFALVGLLGDVVGNDDAACGFALFIETLHHNAVVQGTDFHHDIASLMIN